MNIEEYIAQQLPQENYAPHTMFRKGTSQGTLVWFVLTPNNNEIQIISNIVDWVERNNMGEYIASWDKVSKQELEAEEQRRLELYYEYQRQTNELEKDFLKMKHENIFKTASIPMPEDRDGEDFHEHRNLIIESSVVNGCNVADVLFLYLWRDYNVFEYEDNSYRFEHSGDDLDTAVFSTVTDAGLYGEEVELPLTGIVVAIRERINVTSYTSHSMHQRDQRVYTITIQVNNDYRDPEINVELGTNREGETSFRIRGSSWSVLNLEELQCRNELIAAAECMVKEWMG